MTPEEAHRFFAKDFRGVPGPSPEIRYVKSPPSPKPALRDYGYIEFDSLAAKFYEADKAFRENKAKRGFVTAAIRGLAKMAGLI